MKDLETICTDISQAVDNYHTLKLSQVSEQSEILRELSVNYAYLTDHRIKAKEDWESFYFQSKGTSHAAKQREADQKAPELYMIRKLMDSTRIVIDSVRSTISAAKHDNT